MGQTDGQTSMNVYCVAAYRGVSQKNNVVYIFSVCILQSLTSLLASFSRVGVDKLITTQLRKDSTRIRVRKSCIETRTIVVSVTRRTVVVLSSPNRDARPLLMTLVRCRRTVAWSAGRRGHAWPQWKDLRYAQRVYTRKSSWRSPRRRWTVVTGVVSLQRRATWMTSDHDTTRDGSVTRAIDGFATYR